MRRRDFIALAGGAVAIAPFAALAQQPVRKIPIIGYVQSSQNEATAAFSQGLNNAGYFDRQNVLIEARFHGGRRDRLLELANELVALHCDVIFASSPYVIQAAMTATSRIPIVGVDLESDPVARGWAASLARPGKNLTGLFLDLPELGGKQIELLKEAVPKLSTLAVLWDSSIGEVPFRATELAASVAGVSAQSLPIQRIEEIEEAFDRAARQRVQGMVVLSSPLFFGERMRIASLALKFSLPTISLFTLFPAAGGLMAYGPSLPEMYQRAALYVGRILNGARVSELPIERPTKFELVINLKTAKVLGLEVPPTLLARADEVIE